MKRLPLLALAIALASCDVFSPAPRFEAVADGALERTVEGTGQARALIDLLNPGYALEMEASGEASITFHRSRQIAPAAGTYRIEPERIERRADDFEATIRFDLASETPVRVTDASGVLTVLSCSASQIRGRFDLDGRVDGDGVRVSGTFDLPRGRDLPSVSPDDCR